MFFKSQDSFNEFIGYRCNSIGVGGQAECFLGPDNRVYKVFHNSDICSDESPYSEDFLLRFKGLDNNTFIFADDVINVNGKIVGYISKFIPGKNLSDRDPLRIDLDSLEDNILKARNDIIDISSKDIVLNDVCLNLMIRDDNSFFVKDFDEFSHNIGIYDNKTLIDKNRRKFDKELYLFLVDDFFDEFVNQYKDLKELYKDSTVNVLYFLKLFRKHLSERTGFQIKNLMEASDYLNDNCDKKPYYHRSFLQNKKNLY